MGKKKNPNAVAVGKLGGSKGGKIRAARLSAEQRKEIARKAVTARWAKERARKKQGGTSLFYSDRAKPLKN